MNPDGTIPLLDEDYDDATYDGFQHPDDREYTDAEIEEMQEEDRLYKEDMYNSMRLHALVGFDDPYDELRFMDAELSVASHEAMRTGDWSEHDELRAAHKRRELELKVRTDALNAEAAAEWERGAPERAARAAEAAAAGVQGFGGVNAEGLMAALGKR